jgi:hypothetical protein
VRGRRHPLDVLRRALLLVFCVLVPLGGAAFAADSKQLPLGDGKISAGPRAGYIFSCGLGPGGGGAFADGPWIHGATFDLDAKTAVHGAVSWPDHRLTITASGAAIHITTNDLPSHPTGTFPIASADPAYRYDRNPNSIRAQSFDVSLPVSPGAAASPSCLPGGPIGVMLSGAYLFDGLDAMGRDAVAHEVQDRCGGHPQPQGAYHYHDLTPCLASGPPGRHSALVGYALDGFPIYGPLGNGGKVLTNADLDACHGMTGPVILRGKKVVLYHYVATAEYPYTLGCFHGTPVHAGGAVGGPPPPR